MKITIPPSEFLIVTGALIIVFWNLLWASIFWVLWGLVHEIFELPSLSWLNAVLVYLTLQMVTKPPTLKLGVEA